MHLLKLGGSGNSGGATPGEVEALAAITRIECSIFERGTEVPFTRTTVPAERLSLSLLLEQPEITVNIPAAAITPSHGVLRGRT